MADKLAGWAAEEAAVPEATATKYLTVLDDWRLTVNRALHVYQQWHAAEGPAPAEDEPLPPPPPPAEDRERGKRRRGGECLHDLIMRSSSQ